MDDPSADTAPPRPDANPMGQVPIEVCVAVGRARPSVQEILGLGQDSVLTLDRQVDDPVELFVGDRLIGFGTLEVVDDSENGRLAVRITEVVSPKCPS